MLAARHETLWAAIVAAEAVWRETNGRLYPLAIAQKYALFDVLRDAAPYKALLLGLTLACIAAFAGLVRALADGRTALLCAAFAAAGFALRAYHDANLAYNGMLQLVFLMLVASLFAWRRAVLRRSAGAALLAFALYVANGLTYEIAYLFFPLYACVVRPGRSWPRALAGTWPFALATLGLGLASAYLRSRVAFAPDSDYRAGTQALAYGATFAKQAAAGIPLTYEFLDPQRLFPSLQKIALFDAGPYNFRIPAALAFAAALFAALGRSATAAPNDDERARLGAAGMLGLGLAVLPVPLLAASAKYQRELAWGLGYLPVFVQTFGVALLCAVAMRATRAPRALVALVLFAIADLTSGTNAIVGEAVSAETASRGVVARAFARGLARGVPAGATIVLPSLPWVCEDPLCPDGLSPAYLLYGLTGRRYATVAPGDAYALPTAFRLGYASDPRAATVTLERDGAAPFRARYRETSSGAWSLALR
jgi:hypothetical protein